MAPDPKPASTRKQPSDPAEREAFYRTVRRLDRGCVVHQGRCRQRVHVHHVIPQQVLRRWNLHHLLWDPRNGVSVCERSHGRHHSRLAPLPLACLPERVRGFAAESGFTEWLERHYA